MSSIKRRIAELEVAKIKAQHRPMANAETAVRAAAILNNPNSPVHAKLVEILKRSSEDFRRMRSKEIFSERSMHDNLH